MKQIFVLLPFVLMAISTQLCAQEDVYKLGTDAYDKKHYPLAIKYFTQIIEQNPDAPNPYIARGDCYTLSGDPDKGIADLTKAIGMNPETDALVQAYIDRSSTYGDKKMWTEEIADCQAAIQLDAKSEAAYSNLSGAYMMAGDLDKGLDSAKKSLEMNPDDDITLKFEAEIFNRKKDFLSERAVYEKLLEVTPDRPLTLNNAAWALATRTDPLARDGKKAVELATKACELSKWGKASFIDTLAAAYAEAGDFASAIKYETQVLASPSLNEAAKPEIQARLELYQKNQPFHG